ncbi:MAG: hypothetical protein FWC26_13200 [Fibromonadales bacterium]|nr:hypothetical protein [Fibromonadales bacterium]
MKFRFIFSFSKTERELKVRLGKKNIFDLNPKAKEPKKASTAGSDAAKPYIKKKNPYFQALFDQKVEKRILHAMAKLTDKTRTLFSVEFEEVEIKGTLGDPFYDAIAMGMSGGSYIPDFENKNDGWSAKGEVIFKTGFFHFLFYMLGLIYEFAILAFVLWRGSRLAKKNPNGENLEGFRKWIFQKYDS